MSENGKLVDELLACDGEDKHTVLPLLKQSAAALSEAQAEVSGLRVDAERYRWLRNRATKLAIYSDVAVDVLIDGKWRDQPGELDAAIDAAAGRNTPTTGEGG